MRRIAIALILVALVAGLHACSADAPTPTLPKSNGNPSGSSALQVRLFTNNPNPTAGFCSQIQAVATLNGANVADGTGVAFSTDFGFFQQNGTPLVTVVTQNGAALTAICSNSVGLAKVKASVTVGSLTNSAFLTISFQPSTLVVPFFSFCSPSFGPNTGGTSLTITGGRFFGDASSTRVQFSAVGITREAIVQSVTATTVTVLTPAFPEAISPSVPVDITVTFGTNTASPTVVAAPNCFVFGSAFSDQPTITAVLPSTGSNDGGTRVTIIGSGFQAPLQVFFGIVESAPPISVTFNQIVVLSPSTAGPGLSNLNALVTIRVHNVTSGKDGSLAGAFRFVTKVQITSISNNIQSVDAATFTPVTIFGNGFSAPVAVSLAGIAASISSVSATELVVVPGRPLVSSCADLSGPVVVTNINTGDSAQNATFTYLVKATGPIVNSVTPSSGSEGGGFSADIAGANFGTFAGNIGVTFGAKAAPVSSVSPSNISVTVPPGTVIVNPTCTASQSAGAATIVETVDVTVTNRTTTCSATLAKAFSYTLPCVVPTATPTP